ncbi:Zinc finger LIM-type [Trinorchestia longiramus]|nr:Zinc finger LIM-type [Trinorchestia longiramus]
MSVLLGCAMPQCPCCWGAPCPSDRVAGGGAEPPTAPRGSRGGAVDREDFDDRVKYLEAKFKGEPQRYRVDKKPKDMVRAIGRLEKTDWNLAAIERKIEDNPRPAVSGEAERVPKWSREAYDEKMNTMERRLRANGEKEETIAKYKDVDAYLKRLENKLREGSTLDVGLKGHNKVSNLASQLSSKLTSAGPATEKAKLAGPAAGKAPVVVQLPVNSSDMCYFCNTRVYLVEKLSAEGKFFHRHCFRCHYCNVLLRLGRAGMGAAFSASLTSVSPAPGRRQLEPRVVLWLEGSTAGGLYSLCCAPRTQLGGERPYSSGGWLSFCSSHSPSARAGAGSPAPGDSRLPWQHWVTDRGVVMVDLDPVPMGGLRHVTSH